MLIYIFGSELYYACNQSHTHTHTHTHMYIWKDNLKFSKLYLDFRSTTPHFCMTLTNTKIGLLSPYLQLYSYRFVRCVLWPSSGVSSRTLEPTIDSDLKTLHNKNYQGSSRKFT